MDKQLVLRTLSSIVLILLTGILLIVYNVYLFLIVNIIISFLLTIEFKRIVLNQNIILYWILLVISILIGFIPILVKDLITEVTIIILLSAVIWSALLMIGSKVIKKLKNVNYYILQYLWLVLPASFFVVLVSNYQVFFIYYLLIITASSDTFAYFGGKLFGKNKLAKKVSPGKTIEGSAIAIIFCITISMLLNNYWQMFSNLSAFFLGVSLSLSTQAGDFAQSYFKRKMKVKDSGNIIPGHGGVFDRLDGFLFSTMLYLLYLTIVPN